MDHPNVFFIIKNLILTIVSFGISFATAPLLIAVLEKKKAWKKKPRTETFGGDKTPIFTKFHGEKEVNTPRMGGILIWGSVLIVTGGTFVLSYLFPDSFFGKLSFMSRRETWLPLFALISASVLGLVDDILIVQQKGPAYIGGGIRFKVRLALILLIAIAGAWWFHSKLEWNSIYIPFFDNGNGGNVYINGWYFLLFIIVTVATYSTSVVDGLDGLSAGVLMPIFVAFGVIAYSKGLFDLVSMITVIVGALVAYLWFNVHPARFYMGETGIMGLTVALAVIAFLTNSVLFLPVIGFVLVLESLSVILQLFWKRVFKRKLFISAPIHHHFQALGWPESQITMRFWILSWAASSLGLVLFLLARFF